MGTTIPGGCAQNRQNLEDKDNERPIREGLGLAACSEEQNPNPNPFCGGSGTREEQLGGRKGFLHTPSPWTALSSLKNRSVRDKTKTSTPAVTFSVAGIINLCNTIWLSSEKFIVILLCVLALSFLTPLPE